MARKLLFISAGLLTTTLVGSLVLNVFSMDFIGQRNTSIARDSVTIALDEFGLAADKLHFAVDDFNLSTATAEAKRQQDLAACAISRIKAEQVLSDTYLESAQISVMYWGRTAKGQSTTSNQVFLDGVRLSSLNDAAVAQTKIANSITCGY